MASLYALLVGINEYADPTPPLYGCINDVERVESYIAALSGFDNVLIEKLLNERASKSAIVKGFREHLSQAGKEDTVLFYFSGHGTQEEADPVFWNTDPDRKLEALVCYDSYQIEDGQPRVNLLADKELRFLLKQVAGNEPHILTIFDCCHAGTNTRNGYIGEYTGFHERRLINTERLSQAFPMRRWDQFIFSDAIKKDSIEHKPVTEWLPEGKHIHMAACQPDQSAYEVEGRGVFTRNLLEVLERCQGSVTYYDLQSRIRNYIRNQFDQIPSIYAPGSDENEIYKGFLGRKVSSESMYGNVTYNHSMGWIMDLGSMHGITNLLSVEVRSADGKDQFTTEIDSVLPTYSILNIKGKATDAEYYAYLKGVMSTPVSLYSDVGQPMEELISDIPDLYMTENQVQSAYCLISSEGGLIISRRDAPELPLVPPVSLEDTDLLRKYLGHIVRFEYVKNLINPNAFIFRTLPVDMKILIVDENKEERLVRNPGDRLDLNKSDVSIRISVKSKISKRIYIALFYLSPRFGVFINLFPEIVIPLDPNREVWAMDEKEIRLTVETEVKQFNLAHSISYLKLVVSTEQFKDQASRFALEELPGPLDSHQSVTRGKQILTYPSTLQDWATFLTEVRNPNPEYQEVKTLS